MDNAEKRVERAIFPITGLFTAESRDESNLELRLVHGYAAVFNSLSEDLGGFREQIAPKTFVDSLENRDVAALWSHLPEAPLGRTGNRSLSLSEDETGLKFTLSLPDTSIGRDAWTLIKTDVVRWMSFGFVTEADVWEARADGYVRTLLKVDLHEISPVMFPAYPATDVQSRTARESFEQFKKTQQVIEKPDYSIRKARLGLRTHF